MAVKEPLLILLVINLLIAFTSQNILRSFYTQADSKQVPSTKFEAHRLFTSCLQQVMREHYPLPTKRRAKRKMRRRIEACNRLYECPKFKICF